MMRALTPRQRFHRIQRPQSCNEILVFFEPSLSKESCSRSEYNQCFCCVSSTSQTVVSISFIYDACAVKMAINKGVYDASIHAYHAHFTIGLKGSNRVPSPLLRFGKPGEKIELITSLAVHNNNKAPQSMPERISTTLLS